jgi:prevent-host-death family protein
MTQSIPVTKARNDLLKLVDKVDEEYSRLDLTKRGRVKASLVSSEYLDSLEETIYTLEYSMDDIRKAEKEIDRGEFVTLDDLKKDLQKRLRRHARK